MEIREELEIGVLPPDIWLEHMGQRLCWGPGAEPAPEGPALLALGAELMEVEGGVKQAQKDSTIVENDAMAE